MRPRLLILLIGLATLGTEVLAAPAPGRAASSGGGGRPVMSSDTHRQDGMYRRDATNRMRKDAHERGTEHRVDPDAQGDETAATMRSRSDERKQIQETYRGDRVPGQEGTRGQTDPQKKSWWKFWSS